MHLQIWSFLGSGSAALLDQEKNIINAQNVIHSDWARGQHHRYLEKNVFISILGEVCTLLCSTLFY